MKRIAPWLVSGMALFCAAAQAADMEQASVRRVYTDSVAPADQQAYEAGVRSFNKCLADHGFKFRWTAWLHETGDTYQYSYVSDPGSWADFDAMRAQGKPCDASWRADANPHLKGETSSFLEDKAELSHMNGDMEAAANLMEVTFFKLKRGHEVMEAFVDAVKKITAAANKSKWPGNYTTLAVNDGGQGAPDFIITSYSSSWADFGKKENPALWKMVEGVYGKEAAAGIRKSIGGAIQEVSSHVDSRSAELTYTPSGR
jgi:hypothetical protein